jgi:hypothetical protein
VCGVVWATLLLLVGCSNPQPNADGAAMSDGTVVGDGGSPVAALFVSDWASGTGGSDAVVRDSARTAPWTEYNNFQNHGLLMVVSSGGFGFPSGMSNVLRVDYDHESAGDVTVRDVWGTPAIGSDLYFRLYTRVDLTTAGGVGANHPVESQSGTCAFDWAYKWGIDGAGGVAQFLWQFANTPGHARYVLDRTLAEGQAYRIEWHFRRAAGGYHFDTKIFDATSALVFDDKNFQNSDSVPGSLADNDPLVQISDECMRSLMVGNNGPVGWTAGPNEYAYYGGVRVCASDWCGPYVPGE